MKPSRIEHVSPYRWFLMFFFFVWGGVLKENNATNKVIKNNMNQFKFVKICTLYKNLYNLNPYLGQKF